MANFGYTRNQICRKYTQDIWSNVLFRHRLLRIRKFTYPKISKIFNRSLKHYNGSKGKKSHKARRSRGRSGKKIFFFKFVDGRLLSLRKVRTVKLFFKKRKRLLKKISNSGFLKNRRIGSLRKFKTLLEFLYKKAVKKNSPRIFKKFYVRKKVEPIRGFYLLIGERKPRPAFVRKSNYAKMMLEKQRFKYYYNFRNDRLVQRFFDYCRKKMRYRSYSDLLIHKLEGQLYRFCLRSNFFYKVDDAATAVREGRVLVNNCVVRLLSYLVKPRDVISFLPGAINKNILHMRIKQRCLTFRPMPWVMYSFYGLNLYILRYPRFNEVEYPSRLNLNYVMLRFHR